MALGKAANQKLLPFFGRLGPDFDGFARRGTMLIHRPVSMLMGGFWFDAFPGSPELRWISFFVCPLYVPSDHVWLDWGNRIPRPGPENRSPSRLAVFGSDKDLEDTFRVMTDEGLGCVLPILNLEGFYQYLLSWNYRGSGLQSQSYEAMAYTAALLSKKNEVEEYLFKSEMLLEASANSQNRPDGLFPVEEERLHRVKQIRLLVKDSGHEALVKQLKEWRNLTVQQFAIEDIAITL